MKSKMFFATMLLGAAAMMFTSCKDENIADAVFYQTKEDAQNWVNDFEQLITQLGITITADEFNKNMSDTKMEFYVDNQKLSKTIALNYFVKDEKALNCNVTDFPTFQMDLGKDKSHKCTLKVNLLDGNEVFATGKMECTLEADKCNIVRFKYDVLNEAFELLYNPFE